MNDDGHDVAVGHCLAWARSVDSTLKESDEGLIEIAELKGHCTGAEDRIVSDCAAMASASRPNKEEHLSTLTASYEQACREEKRARKKAGIDDDDGAAEQRVESWRRTLRRISVVFDEINTML